MGVLGLTPFLQKTCPEVIKKLPNRLKDLTGKTIVIDGTLITQRLHYAPAPHPYRHVLGWYRLIRELRDDNVKAICVFDGKERNLAKAEEVERRRHIRRLDTFRADIERKRLQRLNRVTELLQASQHLDVAERQRAADSLKAMMVGQTPSTASPVPLYVAGDLSSVDAATTAPTPIPPPNAEVPTTYGYPDEFDEEDLREILADVAGLPSGVDFVAPSPPSDVEPEHFQTPDDLPFDQLSLDSYNLVRRDIDDQVNFDTTWGLPSPSSDDIPSLLSALYLNYRQSIPELDVLPALPSSAAESTAAPTQDFQADAMSKTQQQLTQAEGAFWAALAQGTDATAPAALATRSSLLVQSYARRSNAPTPETYTESHTILRAMGVPCIETTGPYEAEGLASALVLHGLADYVATEDTDVLAYGAPMLRNITSRKDALLLLAPHTLQAALSLDPRAFLDFLLLLGTDFTARIPHVGPHRALRFVQAHGSIEGVLDVERAYPPRASREKYLALVQRARDVFRTIPPVPERQVLDDGEWDDGRVREVMTRFGLGRYLDGADGWAGALEGNYFGDDPRA
ncbi:PIN domain-like protein [Dentipellis sp. KUC8613]|nr:PIN domain-like protein [Dentipellis sp. KUC8613]